MNDLIASALGLLVTVAGYAATTQVNHNADTDRRLGSLENVTSSVQEIIEAVELP